MNPPLVTQSQQGLGSSMPKGKPASVKRTKFSKGVSSDNWGSRRDFLGRAAMGPRHVCWFSSSCRLVLIIYPYSSQQFSPSSWSFNLVIQISLYKCHSKCHMNHQFWITSFAAPTLQEEGSRSCRTNLDVDHKTLRSYGKTTIWRFRELGVPLNHPFL